MGAFIGPAGNNLRYLEWVRYTSEFGRVEGQRRRVREWMVAEVEALYPDGVPTDVIVAVYDRARIAQDRLFPLPSPEDCVDLPLPVWVDEPLTCEGCGATGWRPGHIEGARITQCSGCATVPKLDGPFQRVVGGAARTKEST